MDAHSWPRPEGGAFHSLRFRDLSLLVRLGWTPEERAHAQEIRVNLEIRFRKPPRAAETDELRDTICYGALAEALTQHLSAREYRLLEKVAADSLRVVREWSGREVLAAVEVQKVLTPVANLRGGAFYRCGDFP